MQTESILAYFCLCQFLWRFSLAEDCPYKECQCQYSSIFCEGKALHSIPVLANRNSTAFTELTLDDNQITTIQSGNLPPNLTQLSLLDNPLTSIDDDAFNSSATTLNSLAFSKPRFNRIPNALLSLHTLQHLQVNDASISDWNIDVLNHIGPTLKSLNLNNVSFTSPPTWLQYLSHVTELNIVASNLSSLPDNALDSMADSLITVSLSSNRLTEVPKALSKLTAIQLLDLSSNRIKSTKYLPISTHAIFVSLNENLIYNSSELSNSLRGCAKSLVALNIQDNLLTSIPDVSFLTGMKSLDFRDNRISDYSSGVLQSNLLALDLENNLLRSIPVGIPGLENLEAIVMTSNIISHIQGADFPPKVETVVLAKNLITALNDDSFPENALFQTLNLNYNPISNISPAAFKHLSLLQGLSLQGTELTRLPLALTSLVDLYSLDVTDTTGLVCTCQEKDLAAWILSPKMVSILGNCGNIKVYDFFSILSPGCPTK
ncbi:unnamed protein product [Candidula unifasciata]|uniref:Uncharacterized protein n=1 Tax=Candidula unifasciata TaxID=100452 RepID=A0A8S3ZCE8_9EUPU|nr:unnamed protein product [Candidula unifasciata]